MARMESSWSNIANRRPEASMSNLFMVLLAIASFYIVQFIVKLRAVRKRYKDWPGLPHDPIWGHLKSIGTYVRDDGYFLENHAEKVWDDIGRPPFFVIDAWPLTRPNVIAICDPELMERIVKASPEHPTSLPKSVTYADLHILFTPDSIVRNVGPPWKQLRKMYSPGFSAKNLQRMLPDLIPEIKIFAARLDKAVGKTITLGEFTTALTIDIIGIVVLGRSFNAQRTSSALLNGFFQCINWQIRQESINPFHLFNPLRPIAHAYYGRKLDTAVDEQVRATLSEKNSLNERSVINLAMLEHDATSTEDFVQASRAQVKTFLLAGHDTTSTFLQYAYYELGRRPEMLEQMRAEHRAIFGQEMKGYHDRVEQALAETPEKVLAAMAYTMGFMKETFRFWGVASTSRTSPPGNNFTAEWNGKSYCFDGHTLPTVDICVRKNPRFYGPDASEFKPERWLDSAEWKIPAMAFRPFERGPRACIAQEMVYIEAKAILAMTIHAYEFEKVQDGGYDRLYSVRRITAKPNDGMRMRVKRAPAW